MTAWQTMMTACGYCDELPCQCPDPDTDDLSEAREFAALSYSRGIEEGLKRARDALAALADPQPDVEYLPTHAVLDAIDALRGES